MKKRRNMNAETQVYFAYVTIARFPVVATTFSWILENIILNSGGHDPAETRIRFQTSRICLSKRAQFSSISSPGLR